MKIARFTVDPLIETESTVQLHDGQVLHDGTVSNVSFSLTGLVHCTFA